ncbi:MAG: SDR family NAD(P)-dependent oxidoreductase [Pseudomonadota bacterium]
MTKKPTIIVTGCSTGIGAHCARRLHEDGWHVIASARKDKDLARLKSEGMDALFLEHREPETIKTFFDDAMALSDGKLAALFNNAGYAQPGAVEDLPIEALREQMEVNFFAYHQLIRLAVPVMRAEGHGRIVNCSSVLGRVAMPWRAAYTSSKYALTALTVTLRMELEGSGVHASLIEPGSIPSNIAKTGARYAMKYIDLASSPHQEGYRKRLENLMAQKPPTDLSGSEPVYRALKKALTARNPRPHYPVKPETHGAILMDRFLGKDFMYRLLSRMA